MDSGGRDDDSDKLLNAQIALQKKQLAEQTQKAQKTALNSVATSLGSKSQFNSLQMLNNNARSGPSGIVGGIINAFKG